ncbi:MULTISPECIES: ABC transporter permease subunit [Streptosporangium]|uniref:ABC-type branched-subunit amino acid transport system ATPase component/branched-subunit amino acid ABC-type transport system permease component n=1 Tax=Streptosporangium brasiliense TaxID=47480 RepID=A0ABT9QVQ8_9ACTN|nr:ATP-binding cassette domain-containing protein [Streptosporangium brasiliense]MDP9861071.1 ABC-type branched-subunit amino acid transport system ATPase component/branched-subunit amino acid ABC-type transport system permease component [Streptosporangium brasiliense]
MSELFGYIVSGLVTGAVFAVMASGLTLSYSATGVFNFAHGAVGFLAALLFFELNAGLGLAAWQAGLVAVGLFSPLLGYVLHRAMFRGLAQAGETAQIVGTIGLTIALPALGLWTVDLVAEPFGLPRADATSLPRGLGPYPAVPFTFGGVHLDSDQLITFGFAALAAAGLWAFMRHTPYGLRMRASVDRRRLATLRGIDADASSAVAWMLGSALAGLAGVLAVSTLGLDSTAFTVMLSVSATAAVFGRLRSIPWTFAAGLGLGVVQNLVAGYADFAEDVTGLRTAVPVILLFAGLILLNRSRDRVAGSAAEDAPPPDYLADLPPWRRRLPWALGLAALLGWTLTRSADDFHVSVVAQGLVLALIFCSFVVVTGIGGMVNLAQASFASMAALTCGWAFSSGLPFPVAILLGVLGATAVGVLVALPALRLGGRILTLATLALALLADQVLFQIDAFSNGTIGWPLPAIGLGFADTTDPRVRVVLLLVLIGLVGLLVRNLERSASGRAVLAVRSAPAAATTSGISAPRAKIMLFALASGIAGLGGVLFAISKGSITATDLPASAGFVWLAVVVLQGVRRIGGAVLGGLIAAVFPELLAGWDVSAHVGAILFGVGGMVLAKHPDGVLAQLAESRHRRRVARRRLDGAAAVQREAPAVTGEETSVGGARPAGEGTSESGARAAAPHLGEARAVGRHPAEALVAGPRPEEGLIAGPRPAEGRAGPEALFRLENVVAGYGDVMVLRGVDLAVRPGEVVALLGANGAGKSTTCAVAAGDLPVTAGRVILDGVDVTSWPAHRRARAGVLLAPEGRGVFPGLTVDENLRTWLADPAPVYGRLPQLARRRGIAAGALSGGEQQLLTLAPALVRPPRVLIADEPSLGLAPLVVEQVFEVFAELRERGVALLLVEEKATSALELADTVVFMRLGRAIWTGPRAEVDGARLTAAYLGVA